MRQFIEVGVPLAFLVTVTVGVALNFDGKANRLRDKLLTTLAIALMVFYALFVGVKAAQGQALNTTASASLSYDIGGSVRVAGTRIYHENQKLLCTISPEGAITPGEGFTQEQCVARLLAYTEKRSAEQYYRCEQEKRYIFSQWKKSLDRIDAVLNPKPKAKAKK